MAHRFLLEAIDKKLRDLMNLDVPFGGDFRQTLPICVQASKAEILASSVVKSKFWENVKVLPLWINKHITEDCDATFADWLLSIGDDSVEKEMFNGHKRIKIPQEMSVNNGTVENLLTEIYDESDWRSPEILIKKAILTPLNKDVKLLNALMLDKIDGHTMTYTSVDTVPDDIIAEYPTEFLNHLEYPGLPEHELNLKVGAIVMTLRNLSFGDGICNGTRMVVLECHDRFIVTKLLEGEHKNNIVVLPMVALIADGETVAVNFKRLQLPVKLAFAMTINKSQGQTLDRVGLYLKAPLFGHGQLYVTISRVRSPKGLKIFSFDYHDHHSYVNNVVFPEILEYF